MHGLLGVSSTLTARRTATKRPRHSATAIARGTDGAGRFIGPRAIEQGSAHFWSAPHRRSQAPRVHSDPVFERDGRHGNSGAKGVPRALRNGLDFAALREMDRLKREGKTAREIAAALDCSAGSVYFHLGGSASMKAALATAPAVTTPSGLDARES